MIKFTLRDLLLLTVIIGVVIGWWTHVRRMQSEVDRLHQRLSTVEQSQRAQRLADQLRQSAVDEKLERLQKEPRPFEFRQLSVAKVDLNSK